ncbi:heavy-metal-associated domain-containing protein [Methanogenium cariaci]|jgi:copper chaperone
MATILTIGCDHTFLFSGGLSSINWDETMTEEKSDKKIHLPVTGMVCDGCVTSVKDALESVAGVKKADVSLEKKEAEVTYDPAQATKEKLKKAVKNAGYDVRD